MLMQCRRTVVFKACRHVGWIRPFADPSCLSSSGMIVLPHLDNEDFYLEILSTELHVYTLAFLAIYSALSYTLY